VLLNGVRGSAIAGRNSGNKETGAGCANREERWMAISLRESRPLVTDPQNLDASVEEVFQLMLGIECERDAGPAPAANDSVTAVVGFGGILSGACVFRLPAKTAIKIVGQMTGMELLEVDDTVKDGIGEICNMLAGAWKGKVPSMAANTGLSVPAVITGRDYNLHVQAPEFQIHHGYRFGEETFAVTIICDGMM
jgi:chemotaxis protein CheX